MEQRTNWDTFHHVANDAWLATRGNNGIDTRTTGYVSRLQLGAHAAGSKA